MSETSITSRTGNTGLIEKKPRRTFGQWFCDQQWLLACLGAMFFGVMLPCLLLSMHKPPHQVFRAKTKPVVTAPPNTTVVGAPVTAKPPPPQKSGGSTASGKGGSGSQGPKTNAPPSGERIPTIPGPDDTVQESGGETEVSSDEEGSVTITETETLYDTGGGVSIRTTTTTTTASGKTTKTVSTVPAPKVPLPPPTSGQVLADVLLLQTVSVLICGAGALVVAVVIFVVLMNSFCAPATSPKEILLTGVFLGAALSFYNPPAYFAAFFLDWNDPTSLLRLMTLMIVGGGTSGGWTAWQVYRLNNKEPAFLPRYTLAQLMAFIFCWGFVMALYAPK